MLLPHSPLGIVFVDLSKLQVCHNLVILRHQVFKNTPINQEVLLYFDEIKINLWM
uniref:hypothetical protein n=1 Tax=Candidatus Enterovibrio escicola TaxID=1927127 RepID=UPI001314B01F|nr:hypothetical protein [Candidatus Enterovibrio escacola]